MEEARQLLMKAHKLLDSRRFVISDDDMPGHSDDEVIELDKEIMKYLGIS